MNNSSLMTVLSRLAWILSLTLGSLLAFIICDLDSGMYSSGGENFVLWGWIWALIFTVIIKQVFLSGTFLSDISIDGGYSQPKTSIQPIEPQYSDAVSDSVSEPGEDPMLSKPLMINDTPESIYVPPSSEEDFQDPPVFTAPREPDKPSWIVTFFSDRPLAKIGGIILFLAAFFFLSLVWSSVGDVGKVIIGLIFGFSLYGIGVWMDTKGHITESRTLLGVGIAVNTLTILSGRWIIGDASGSIFSDTVTLVFLVLNTLFAVATGLVYSSRTFLVFSFVFAYLIPFLVRSESDSAILMMLYVATISLGGLLLVWTFSLRNERADDMKWLFRTIIIGSLILLSLTGLGIDNQAELILLVIITLLLASTGIFISRKTESRDESLPSLLIGAYTILACSLFGIGDGNQGTILIAFFGMVPLMVYTGIFMVGAATLVYSWILLAPLLLGLILLGIFGVSSLVFILLPIVFLYGLSGFFLISIMSVFFQYVFFLAISIFLFICALTLDVRPANLSSTERFITSLSALGFFLLSLWSSYKYKLVHLSLITLISSSFILVFSLVGDWTASWIFYILFLTIAFVYPFFLGNSIREQFRSFIGYQVVVNLFMIGELFYLGRGMWFTGESSSLITLGIIVFVLSVLSLIYSLVLIRTTTTGGEISALSREEKASAIALLGIPLSLFSLAVAVTFSDSPLVVSTAWILESCVLAYYSSKDKNRMVLAGSLVLLAIGILRLLPFFDTVQSGHYFALVPVTIIALGLFFSLSFIPKREDEPLGNLYDLLHIFGISLVAYAVMEIVPHTRTGWSLLGLNLFLLLSTWFYTRIQSKIISFWMVFLTIGVFFYHLVRMENLDMSFGPVMIQLFALMVGTYSVWYMKNEHPLGKYAFIYAFIMFLWITSLYVNNITNNVFAVTIYLTIVATLYLLIGINENNAKYRTIGLYIGTAVLIKILFYDIWAGVDNLIIRVVALMITGGIMIAISQLYGRRVNRPWNEEFAFSNFLSSSPDQARPYDIPQEEELSGDPEDMPFDETVAKDLINFDISHIASIELQDVAGDTILSSRRAGIIRVANYLTMHLGKVDFAPGELEKLLLNILPHIQSSLPKKDLENIVTKIHNWIKKGGKIVINKKN